LLWIAEWHIRDETYQSGLACLVDAIHAQPFTKIWDDGDTSSSDGQFFKAGGHGEARADYNAKYGSEPGVKFYTHVSDRYAPFHTKVIAANASEAAHILDGLLHHECYVGVINWLLMIVTIGLTLFFGKSDNLAAAYGIAVSATMLMTSALLFIAMREIWGWGLLASGAIAGAFLCVDASFFLATLVKVADGGYVPLLLASIVYGVMLIWHRGSTAVAQVLNERVIPVSEFMGPERRYRRDRRAY
jgi:hypothetical protein